MNREEFLKFHEHLTLKMKEITAKKNADYTGAAGDDPFANFNRVASLGVCSTEQGFLVRILDKFMRISSFVSIGNLQVKDESVEDTLLDLANYCLLFLGYLESKKGKWNEKNYAPTSIGGLTTGLLMTTPTPGKFTSAWKSMQDCAKGDLSPGMDRFNND